MVDGVADPSFEKKKVQPFRAGISYRARDGSRMAETAKGGLGSRQPGLKGCARDRSTEDDFYRSTQPEVLT
jgi:hypothetical protein